MRGDYQRETTSVVTWLLCAIAGAFFIQFAADSRWFAPLAGLTAELSLSIAGLATGRIWPLLTHWLLHRTDNLLHLGTVLAGLFLLRRELGRDLGAGRFVTVFGAGLLAGALVWCAVNWRTGGELMGSVAGLGCLVTVWALLRPRREIRFLLLFFFPVTIRPRPLLFSWLAIDSLAFLLVNVLGRDLPFAYAPAAHLGGMMAGWVYCRFIHESEGQFGRRSATMPRELAQVRSAASSPLPSPDPASTPDRPREDLRIQVDRVLDKINSEGLGALTPAERSILEEAKALLSRR